MAAACRFTVLLLFYGLLQLDTKWYVALTTAGTSGFLIAKVLFFDVRYNFLIPVVLKFLISYYVRAQCQNDFIKLKSVIFTKLHGMAIVT